MMIYFVKCLVEDVLKMLYLLMQAVLIQWPYPNSFLSLQMVASIMVVYTMKAWGLSTVQPLHMKAARALLPVVFFYNTNVGFALAAVRALSIPVYHVLKRLTPVMVLVGKFLMGGSTPSKQITLSVVTVVSGNHVASKAQNLVRFMCF